VKVTVVYAGATTHHVLLVDVAGGTTVSEAVAASELARLEPHLDLARATLGVWNRRVAGETPLRAGDRIEVYRPLTIEPKEARRRRADVRRRRKMGA
jgi:putative ubiquitin-RnfH superfamily antitoxin RatB of RatAB toxin-antitoxin module